MLSSARFGVGTYPVPGQGVGGTYYPVPGLGAGYLFSARYGGGATLTYAPPSEHFWIFFGKIDPRGGPGGGGVGGTPLAVTQEDFLV